MGLKKAFMAPSGAEGEYIKIESIVHLANKELGEVCLSLWKNRTVSKQGYIPLDFIDIAIFTKNVTMANLYTAIKANVYRSRGGISIDLTNAEDIIE